MSGSGSEFLEFLRIFCSVLGIFNRWFCSWIANNNKTPTRETCLGRMQSPESLQGGELGQAQWVGRNLYIPLLSPASASGGLHLPHSFGGGGCHAFHPSLNCKYRDGTATNLMLFNSPCFKTFKVLVVCLRVGARSPSPPSTQPSWGRPTQVHRVTFHSFPRTPSPGKTPDGLNASPIIINKSTGATLTFCLTTLPFSVSPATVLIPPLSQTPK